ncbi:nuclear transport factor 2 family protein [Flavobacterium sp. SM2513]|uniref:nuclear transport factor 2 family protein n=1 Tax=Flavobacterium sp. SM2513 TaxID=3424766 RepID=UPI003D7FA95F
MTTKKIIQDFYKSEAFINVSEMEPYLHPEFILEWQSSKGFSKLDKQGVLDLTKELSASYVRSKIRILSLVQEKNQVAVRYSHFVKTVENPREEMLLAHFFVIWEVKDDKLYRGYQMSQIS